VRQSRYILARTAAAAIDTIVVLSLSVLLIRAGFKWFCIPLVCFMLLEVGYHLRGSLGKSLFGLSVTSSGRKQYYLRETVGKIASTAIFGIGFFLVFSKEGLALHDLIARTCVVPAKQLTLTMQGIRAFLLIVVAGTVGYFGAKLAEAPSGVKTVSSQFNRPLDSITRQTPAVLTINCYSEKGKRESLGSGFLISSDGIAVTNFHVIRDAFRAEAELGDGRLYQVIAVRAFDPDKDIAILQLGRRFGERVETASELPFVKLGASGGASVGDRIATISSPEGLANTVSDGLISAVRKEGNRTLLQISAPVSPGSSGGPVFDSSGSVIAVTVAQFTEGQNLNFAIPIETVNELRQKENIRDFDEFRVLSAAISATSSEGETNTSRDANDNEASSREADITGLYVGVAHNLTEDLSSGFGIAAQDKDGSLEGCMGVHEPLYGSGPLEGERQGSRVKFEVKGAVFTLMFNGIVHGKKISGSYIATAEGGSPQHGEFYLEKQKGRTPYLSGECPTDEQMNSKKESH
jgi:S1-C subfamily serine protease